MYVFVDRSYSYYFLGIIGAPVDHWVIVDNYNRPNLLIFSVRLGVSMEDLAAIRRFTKN